MATKNITLVTFTTDYAAVQRIVADAKATNEGAFMYPALAALCNADVVWGEERNNGKGGAKGGTTFAETWGFDKGQFSKACRVIVTMMPNYASLTNVERTAEVIRIMAEHGSLATAYDVANVTPKREPAKRGPKTALELLATAARQAQAEGMGLYDFLAAAEDAHTSAQ